MTSAIDPTKPTTGNATTASVRTNFQAAKDEIEALQALTPLLLYYKKAIDLAAVATTPLDPVPNVPTYWRGLKVFLLLRSGKTTGSLAGNCRAPREIGGTMYNAFPLVGTSFDSGASVTAKVVEAATALLAQRFSGTPDVNITAASSTPCTCDIYLYGFALPLLP